MVKVERSLKSRVQGKKTGCTLSGVVEKLKSSPGEEKYGGADNECRRRRGGVSVDDDDCVYSRSPRRAPSATHLHGHSLSTDRTHHPHTANPTIMRRPCYNMPRHAGRSLWIHAMTSPAIRHINHDRPRRQRQSPPPRGDDSRRGGGGGRRA